MPKALGSHRWGQSLADEGRVATVLALLLLAAFTQDSLGVQVVSGVADPKGRIPVAKLGLGTGGLLPRAKWSAGWQATGPTTLRTRGGAVIDVLPPRVRIALPSGRELTIDEQARLLGDKRLLTQAAWVGLEVRLLDGTELRVLPGSKRGPRRVSLVDGEHEIVLVRQGHVVGTRVRGQAFHGLRYYIVGQGDEVASIMDCGPCLFVRPIATRGRKVERRLVVLGDVLRASVETLRAATPQRSAQYPLATKHAAFLNGLVQRAMPAGQPREARTRSLPGSGIVIGQGPEQHWLLRMREAGGLTFSLHLEAGAEASLEFVSSACPATLHRVLPKSRQGRSRYLGRGVTISESMEAALPWSLPLGHWTQRRRSLEVLKQYLETAVSSRAQYAADGRHR